VENYLAVITPPIEQPNLKIGTLVFWRSIPHEK
jgi:hypothetical protein